MRQLPPRRPVVLRKRPLSQVEPLPPRTVAHDLGAFMSSMVHGIRLEFTGSILLAALSVTAGIVGLTWPAWMFCFAAAFLFSGACFGVWRKEYSRRQELEAENLALRQPPAMIEMRGAEFEAVAEEDFGVDWRLHLWLYITPTPGQPISFPLHKCEITIRATGWIDQPALEKPIRPGLDFSLMMGVHDPESDSGTILVTTEGEVLFVGRVKIPQGSVRKPPDALQAHVVLRDSQGGWFENLDVVLEKQRRPDGGVFWMAWPDLPREPVFRDDE